MNVKDEVRILGIDDSPFDKEEGGRSLVVGTVFRAGERLEGVLSTFVKVDGKDATERVIEMVEGSRHEDQIGVLMVDGVALGGFNVLDVSEIYERTGIPVIVLIRREPNFQDIEKALSNFEDGDERYEKIRGTGEVKEVNLTKGSLYFQCEGISKKDSKKVIKLSSVNSIVPEPVRVAHLICSGIIKGESKGRV